MDAYLNPVMPRRSFRENSVTRVKIRPSVKLYFIVSFLWLYFFGICRLLLQAESILGEQQGSMYGFWFRLTLLL